MTPLDDFLRNRRMARVGGLVPSGSRVLDVGCRDGHLFEYLGDRLGEGVGIDPEPLAGRDGARYRLLTGWFPQDLPDDVGTFDVITLVAVLEHLQPDAQSQLVADCRRLLNPGGRVVLTVPSKEVDQILKVLMAVRLVADDSVDQHWGFDARRLTAPLFERAGFSTLVHRKFQLGLNNLFCFQAP
ncbi:MAG: class I SAM-dependent methyltransferase [Actinomycetes bacterium]